VGEDSLCQDLILSIEKKLQQWIEESVEPFSYSAEDIVEKEMENFTDYLVFETCKKNASNSVSNILPVFEQVKYQNRAKQLCKWVLYFVLFNYILRFVNSFLPKSMNIPCLRSNNILSTGFLLIFIYPYFDSFIPWGVGLEIKKSVILFLTSPIDLAVKYSITPQKLLDFIFPFLPQILFVFKLLLKPWIGWPILVFVIGLWIYLYFRTPKPKLIKDVEVKTRGNDEKVGQIWFDKNVRSVSELEEIVQDKMIENNGDGLNCHCFYAQSYSRGKKRRGYYMVCVGCLIEYQDYLKFELDKKEIRYKLVSYGSFFTCIPPKEGQTHYERCKG